MSIDDKTIREIIRINKLINMYYGLNLYDVKFRNGDMTDYSINNVIRI